MPESTVVQSILGTLGQIGGIGGRRAQDGLTAAQAESYAIKNKADKIIIQDDEDTRTFGELDAAGYVTVDPNTGRATIDGERLANENPELLSRFIGPEANRFLSTKTANGNQPVSFAGVKKIDPRISKDPALGAYPQELSPQEGPSNYVIQLRTQDGRTVPATQNASAAADDTLITMDGAALNKTLQGRLDRMYASGALDNNVTMTKLNLAFKDASDAYLQNELAKTGADGLTDDPTAKRSFYGMLNDLHGQDLNDALVDAGLDPDKLRDEAEHKWVDRQIAERKKIPLNTEDMTMYESTKELLSNQVERTTKALADHDAARSKNDIANSVDEESIRAGYPTLRMLGGQNPNAAPKTNSKDPMNRTGKGGVTVRDKLVAERDAAQAALAKLKPPVMKPLQSGAPMPKFEWNENNLRESVRGAIGEQPTPEQTAALTKYAKDQGVSTAQDLAKLPKNDAMALAWIIASNARGADAAKRVEIFNSLANYARTGDAKKSPIDANVAVTGARVDVANSITASRGVDVAAKNAELDYAVGMANVAQDAEDYSLKLAEYGYKRASEVGAQVDKFYKDYTSKIIQGATGGDPADPQSGGVSIKDTGPNTEMLVAMNGLSNAMMNAPEGSPQQLAASQQFLQGFSVYAASAAAMTGKPAFWDLKKQFTNFFLRENATVPVGDMIQNLKIEYANGKPSKFRVLEAGAGSDRTEVIAGADTIDRIIGGGYANMLEQALTVQHAKNLVEKEGKQWDETTAPAAIAAVREANGVK